MSDIAPETPSGEGRLMLAKARATVARARLSNTIAELQERARPASLAHDVSATLKQRGSDMALGLIDIVKRKPARASATLALVGVFLARRRIIRLFRRGDK